MPRVRSKNRRFCRSANRKLIRCDCVPCYVKPLSCEDDSEHPSKVVRCISSGTRVFHIEPGDNCWKINADLTSYEEIPEGYSLFTPTSYTETCLSCFECEGCEIQQSADALTGTSGSPVYTSLPGRFIAGETQEYYVCIPAVLKLDFAVDSAGCVSFGDSSISVANLIGEICVRYAGPGPGGLWFLPVGDSVFADVEVLHYNSVGDCSGTPDGSEFIPIQVLSVVISPDDGKIRVTFGTFGAAPGPGWTFTFAADFNGRDPASLTQETEVGEVDVFSGGSITVTPCEESCDDFIPTPTACGSNCPGEFCARYKIVKDGVTRYICLEYVGSFAVPDAPPVWVAHDPFAKVFAYLTCISEEDEDPKWRNTLIAYDEDTEFIGRIVFEHAGGICPTAAGFTIVEEIVAHDSVDVELFAEKTDDECPPCVVCTNRCHAMGSSGSYVIGCAGTLQLRVNDGFGAADNYAAVPGGWAVEVFKNGVSQGTFNFDNYPAPAPGDINTGISFSPGDVISWTATGSLYMNGDGDCPADPDGNILGACTTEPSTDGTAGCPDLQPWSLVFQLV